MENKELNTCVLHVAFKDTYDLRIDKWVDAFNNNNLLLTELNLNSEDSYRVLTNFKIPMRHIQDSDVIIYKGDDFYHILKNRYGSYNIRIESNDELYNVLQFVIKHNFFTINKI